MDSLVRTRTTQASWPRGAPSLDPDDTSSRSVLPANLWVAHRPETQEAPEAQPTGAYPTRGILNDHMEGELVVRAAKRSRPLEEAGSSEVEERQRVLIGPLRNPPVPVDPPDSQHEQHRGTESGDEEDEGHTSRVGPRDLVSPPGRDFLNQASGSQTVGTTFSRRPSLRGNPRGGEGGRKLRWRDQRAPAFRSSGCIGGSCRPRALTSEGA